MIQTWGADTQELDKALSLARYRGDVLEAQRLEQALALVRSACPHLAHPSKPQCVKCGLPNQVKIEPGPGLRKVSVQDVIRKTA